MYNLDIEGHMTESELIQIEKWAAEVPENGIIVELGSLKGRSAYAWAKSCHPSVKVYCIDKFSDTRHYDNFVENTKDCPNIVILKGIFPRNIKYLGPMVDLFFLDANHTNPQDIDAINEMLPHMKLDGLFCGHDYYENFDYSPDIKTNIKELEQRLNQPVTLHPSTTLWSFRI